MHVFNFAFLLLMAAASPWLPHYCAASIFVTRVSLRGHQPLRSKCCSCPSRLPGCYVRPAAHLLSRYCVSWAGPCLPFPATLPPLLLLMCPLSTVFMREFLRRCRKGYLLNDSCFTCHNLRGKNKGFSHSTMMLTSVISVFLNLFRLF